MSARCLSNYLKMPCCNLTCIDLNGNNLTEDDVQILLEGLEENMKIVSFDLRLNALPADASILETCKRLLQRNEIELRNK